MKKIYGLGGKKIIYFFVALIFCLPHVVLYLCNGSCKKNVINHDVRRWIDCTGKEHHSVILDLLYLLVFIKEFRNLYYLRLGKMSFVLRYLRPLSSLYICTKSENFGAGTFIQHGFATVITAEKIGKECWINQQVTIGYNDSKKYGFGRPRIGDHVRISAGAKVCGNIEVENDCTIGLNAVVIKSLPEKSVVVPSPMMLIQESGVRVSKRF